MATGLETARPNVAAMAAAVATCACQLLTRNERSQLVTLLSEQLELNQLGRSGEAVADLAAAAETLVANAAFATALGTAGWQVIP